MAEISFFVPGVPCPGGSKRPVRAGGKADGKIVLVDDAKGHAAWRDRVASYATAAYAGPLLDGPLDVAFEFTVTRPRGHYGTGRNAGRLRGSAPPYPLGRPDLTKLVRACEDSLTGILWTDDSRIVTQHASKRYGERPGVRVAVVRIGGGST